MIARTSFLLLFTLVVSGCAAHAPPAPAPRPPRAVAEGDPPFMPGPLPDGWRLQGVYVGAVQFVHPDDDAAVTFLFFSAASESPASMIRRAASENGAKLGVAVTDIDTPFGGTEASLRFTDDRFGKKRGRIVARCYPDRTMICALVAGLWPADKEPRHQADYATFLSWVRTDP